MSKTIEIPEWQLKKIKDALRVTANAYGCRKKSTCLDRMVTQAEQFAENALNGETDKQVSYL
jgi:hypothetical protein